MMWVMDRPGLGAVVGTGVGAVADTALLTAGGGGVWSGSAARYMSSMKENHRNTRCSLNRIIKTQAFHELSARRRSYELRLFVNDKYS